MWKMVRGRGRISLCREQQVQRPWGVKEHAGAARLTWSGGCSYVASSETFPSTRPPCSPCSYYAVHCLIPFIAPIVLPDHDIVWLVPGLCLLRPAAVLPQGPGPDVPGRDGGLPRTASFRLGFPRRLLHPRPGRTPPPGLPFAALGTCDCDVAPVTMHLPPA